MIIKSISKVQMNNENKDFMIFTGNPTSVVREYEHYVLAFYLLLKGINAQTGKQSSSSCGKKLNLDNLEIELFHFGRLLCLHAWFYWPGLTIVPKHKS